MSHVFVTKKKYLCALQILIDMCQGVMSLCQFKKCPQHMSGLVTDYDEACFMHLTPGVVHNFPKVVGV